MQSHEALVVLNFSLLFFFLNFCNSASELVSAMRKHALFFFILAILASVAWEDAKAVETSRTSGLYSIVPSFEAELGDFNVLWDLTKLQLAVTHKRAPKRVLWSSVPRSAFLESSWKYMRDSQVHIKQWSGNFKIEKWEESFSSSRQYLTGFARSNESIRFAGELEFPLPEPTQSLGISFNLSDSSALKVHYVFIVEMVPEESSHLRFRISLDWSRTPKEIVASMQDKLNYISLIYQSDVDEKFYGFGEQFSFVNLKGKKIPIFVREQGNGRGLQPITYLQNLFLNYSGGDWDTTYAPAPQYISSQLRAFFLEGTDFSIFDLSEPSRVKIDVEGLEIIGRISYGDSILSLVESFTSYSGRAPVLPKWMINGSVIGAEGGSAFIRNLLQKMSAFEIPVSAFWLQDWVGSRKAPWGQALWWNWEYNRVTYPDWPQLISELRSQGIRMMNYLNPMLADVSGLDGQFTRNLYKEAVTQGFDVRIVNSTGNEQPYRIYLDALLVDLYNPEARKWYKEAIRELVLGNGESGYMCDFGEAYPLNAMDYSSRKLKDNSLAHHNQYAIEWMKLNREIIEEMPEREIVFFTRSGFTKAPGLTPLNWLGDQMVTWDRFDGLQSAIQGLLSSGFSGYTFSHTDIGGYQSFIKGPFRYSRTKELFLRWTEFSAFTTVMRTHFGSNPDLCWQVNSDSETMEFFARFVKIYQSWEFYRSELIKEASLRGYPVNRHLIFHFHEDNAVHNLQHQFLVGSEWIVAPVIRKGSSRVQVYLPQGLIWEHLWSSKKISGGKHLEVFAPLGCPALFFPTNSSTGLQFKANLAAKGLLDHCSKVKFNFPIETALFSAEI